jgi:Ca-activated chloride channel family protein
MLPFPLPFARPEVLYLLVLLPVFGLVAIIAGRRRKAALARLGRPETVASLSTLRFGSRRRSRLILFGGLICLIVAGAGPRWGKGGESGVVVGRDLIIVLDLSRSMSATDMADPVHQQRWEAAKAGVHKLVNEIQRHGGHRMGLVVFAAKPWIVCPLTSDYDHFRARLDEYSPKAPPTEVRPEPDEPIATGTAIGAAIRMALVAHDPRFPGYQDILLLSDGDGPGIESESEGGIKDAADRQVPVHVVGVGDPVQSTPLVLDADNVEFTKLQESILRDVARRTRGEYLSARRDVPPIDEWFTRVIAPRPSRELSDDALPQPKDRAVWFIGAGLLFVLLSWIREP